MSIMGGGGTSYFYIGYLCFGLDMGGKLVFLGWKWVKNGFNGC